MAYILIVALCLGLGMFLWTPNAKSQEIGKLMFFAATLALLIALAPLTVQLLR